VLEPMARQQMDEIRQAAGRPMDHDLRAMIDAIGYLVRNGIEWRALPADFPPWQSVYAFFQRWNQRELPQRLSHRLRDRLRSIQDRLVQPSAAIIDSQSVKAAEWAGKHTQGFDGNKKVGGRKRHIAVDVNGFLLAVAVTAANLGDRSGAKLLIIALLDTGIWLKQIWADTGYDGWPLRQFVWNLTGALLTASPRGAKRSFRATPRRWVVERTFAWLMRHRRLARDYERLPGHHEAVIWWATIMIMTRRIARRDQPVPRWNHAQTATPRPAPA